MSPHPDPEPCRDPDLALLRRLLREELDGPAYNALEQHLQVCPDCQRALDDLGRDLTPPPITPVVADAAGHLLPEVPGYRLTGLIKSGGMGVVYQAIDLALQRDVAIKVLRKDLLIHPSSRTRFLEEARITAQLQHPGIPPVHQIGTLADGRPFLAMKLIKGQTLEDLGAAEPEATAAHGWFTALFEKICQTVAYAHGHGVIHRDLKPDNVMIGKYGEVQVMDWGLAKHLGAGPPEPPPPDPPPARVTGTAIRTSRDPDSFTEHGSVLGTWRYMPPEQAGGEIDQIDQRSDVFALGGILCFLLTGAPPYRGTSEKALRLMAIRGDLTDAFARLDACAAEPELIALARRCLAPRRDDRPADAEEVARTISQIRISAEERARKAELDRVQAEADRARAQLQIREERKRRRFIAALAVTSVLMIATATAALWTVERHQAARREQTAMLVNQALGQAESLRRDAAAAPLDHPAQWTRARDQWQAVLHAVAQAERALAAAATTPALRNRTAEAAAALHQDAAAAARDLDMLERLDAARLAKIHLRDADAVSLQNRPYVFGRAGLELYPRAFRDYGIDLDQLDDDTAIARIRASKIQTQLLAALDDWYLVDPRTPTAERLLRIAEGADADPLRKRIRAAIGRQDRTALLRIADSPEADSLSAQSALLLAAGLETPSHTNDSARVLERALRRFPDDFWLDDLAGLYFQSSNPPRWAEAAAAYQASLAARPAIPAILANLGNAFRSLGQFDRALAALEQALELDPDYSLTRDTYIRCLIDNGNLAAAETEARAWIHRQPDSIVARTLLASLLHLTGRGAEARQLVPDLDQDPDQLRSDLDLIRISVYFYEINQLDKAIPWLQEAIRRAEAAQHDTGAGLLVAYRGLARFQTGQRDAGLADLRRAAELAPGFAVTWDTVATGLLETGQSAAALDAARKAIERAPYTAGFRANLVLALLAAGRAPEALMAAEEAVHLNPHDVRAQLALARALLQLNRPAEAVQNLEQTLRTWPGNPFLRDSLAEALLRAGNAPAAAALYEETLRQMPDNARLHNLLGNAHAECKNYPRALDAYRRALALDAQNPVFLTNLAHTCRLVNHRAEALELYRRALALAPHDVAVRRAYRDTLAAFELRDLMITEARTVVRLAPHDATDAVLLSMMLLRAGQFEEARAWAEKAVTLRPEDPRTHWCRAVVLRDLGRPDDAIAGFQHAAELTAQGPAAAPQDGWMLQYDLGLAFQNARRFPEALAAFLRARERAAANPAATQNLSPERRAHWQALDQQIDLCRRFIRSEGILEGLRLDYVTAADPLRALELATHALLLNRPAIATRLAEEVFARQPALADDLDRNYRLIAALAAAWASCGQGEDAAALDAAERTRLRRRALDWLRADLAASPPARIQPWLTHPALARVRDPAELAKLPNDARQDWEAFWIEVQNHLAPHDPRRPPGT